MCGCAARWWVWMYGTRLVVRLGSRTGFVLMPELLRCLNGCGPPHGKG